MSALQKAITCSLHPKIPSNSARQRCAADPSLNFSQLRLLRATERSDMDRKREGYERGRHFGPLLSLDLAFLLQLFSVSIYSSVVKCTFVMPIEGIELELKTH